VTRDPPLCSLRELQDGTYSIDDLADFHEVMAEEAEYERRYEAAAKAKKT
jgi:hypothetical protein